MNERRSPKVPVRRTKQESNFSTFLAVFFLLFICGAFLMLLGFATGGGLFFFVPVIIIAATLFGMLHYLVWGRLISRDIPEDEEDLFSEET